MQELDIIFYIVILIMSVVIHEVSHGFMALYFGDQTAKHAGRLTLNPLPHLDIFGSVFLPALLAITKAPFMIGWAKPVPYNPDNLTDKKWGEVWVAGAGILSNLFLAIFFGLILRFVTPHYFSEGLVFILSTIVLVNLSLAIFNLVPIPPLDGSKILFGFLPASARSFINFMEQYAFVLLIVFIVFFSDVLYPILAFLFRIITGFGL